jgi:hypothetical protein
LFILIVGWISEVSATTPSPSDALQEANQIQFSSDSPKILTNNILITSYQNETVILPCEISNLPNNLYVSRKRK